MKKFKLRCSCGCIADSVFYGTYESLYPLTKNLECKCGKLMELFEVEFIKNDPAES